MYWKWKNAKVVKDVPITNLANEIVQIILQHLNQFDLTRIILINKWFYEVGIRMLYNHIYVNNGINDNNIFIHPDKYDSTRLTIINQGLKIFKKRVLKKRNIKFINSITFFNDSGLENIYKYLIKKCSWVNITILNPSLNGVFHDNQKRLFGANKLTRFRDNHIRSLPLFEDNYTIQEYIIDIVEPGTLQLIPMLKLLNSLEINDSKLDVVARLKYHNLKNISVESLILNVFSIQLAQLEDVFNLTRIKTLKISSSDSYSKYDELKQLTRKLSNLTNISINWKSGSLPEMMYNLSSVNNCLAHINLKTDQQFQVNHLNSYRIQFIKHEKSLVTLNLTGVYENSVSTAVRHGSIFKRWFRKGNQEINYVEGGSDKSFDVRMFIRGRFPKLKQIVINDWYFIIKNENDDRQVIPVQRIFLNTR